MLDFFCAFKNLLYLCKLKLKQQKYCVTLKKGGNKEEKNNKNLEIKKLKDI